MSRAHAPKRKIQEPDLATTSLPTSLGTTQSRDYILLPRCLVRMESPTRQFITIAGCGEKSSQAAANFYENGIKLGTKRDLADIGEQLADSKKSQVLYRSFHQRHEGGYSEPHVRRRVANLASMMCSNTHTLLTYHFRKPYVGFQEYWRLVKEQPVGPEQKYHCSYLPHWDNISAKTRIAEW